MLYVEPKLINAVVYATKCFTALLNIRKSIGISTTNSIAKANFAHLPATRKSLKYMPKVSNTTRVIKPDPIKKRPKFLFNCFKAG